MHLYQLLRHRLKPFKVMFCVVLKFTLVIHCSFSNILHLLHVRGERYRALRCYWFKVADRIVCTNSWQLSLLVNLWISRYMLSIVIPGQTNVALWGNIAMTRLTKYAWWNITNKYFSNYEDCFAVCILDTGTLSCLIPPCLYRILAKDASFELRLHLIYLVNDLLHHW